MLELNKIHQGDCLELMKQIEDKSIDLILCDLPYGITACKWDCEIDLHKLWDEYKRIIKDTGTIVLTAINPFASKLVMSNLNMFMYEWIWDKKKISNPMIAKKQPLRQHENILVFYNKNNTYNPQPYLKKTIGIYGKQIDKHSTDSFGKSTIFKNKGNLNEFGYPRTIINQINVLNNLGKDKSGLHPTQKPIALFEYLINTYTNKGDLVLDNCIGSGTTAVACLKTNRNFIGIELSPEYCKIANDRIDKLKELE